MGGAENNPEGGKGPKQHPSAFSSERTGGASHLRSFKDARAWIPPQGVSSGLSGVRPNTLLLMCRLGENHRTGGRRNRERSWNHYRTQQEILLPRCKGIFIQPRRLTLNSTWVASHVPAVVQASSPHPDQAILLTTAKEGQASGILSGFTKGMIGTKGHWRFLQVSVQSVKNPFATLSETLSNLKAKAW